MAVEDAANIKIKFSFEMYNINGNRYRFNYYRPKTMFGKKDFLKKVIKIYLNGNAPEDEGYVSIMFVPEKLREVMNSFNCTVSLVDAIGELRFAQSIEIDLTVKYPKAEIVGLDKFIRRDFLMESIEDFLSAATLQLHFDFLVNTNKPAFNVTNSPTLSKEFRWVYEHLPDIPNVRRLDLNKLDNDLRTKLCEKSKYFKWLFEMKQNCILVEETEMSAFMTLMKYFCWKGVIMCPDSFKECINVYMAADKYWLLELKEMFSTFLKHHLENETAAEIFAVSDSCNDPPLRETALEYATSNWEEVQITDNWSLLRESRPDLEQEVLSRIETVESYQQQAEEFDFYR